MPIDLNQLNPGQREAAEHVDGPLLVLAGAGSGKTRVITFRAARLLELGIPAEEILVVTFTNKAASEMRQRVTAMIGKRRGSNLTLSTFHAFGARMLRSHIHHLGFTSQFTILDETDRNRLIRSSLLDVGLKKTGMKTDQIVRWISLAKQKRTSPAGLREAKFSPLLPHAQRVFSSYQDGLKALNGVDFDDLLVLPLRLLDEFEVVRNAVRSRYKYVMVDEYQDTNLVQLDLLRGIVGERANLVAVGDDDQSIYGFRGAVASNILEFERHFPGTKTVTLDQNYRSTTSILDAANGVIANNTKRHVKRLWSAHGEGERVRHVSCAHERDEAAFVVNEIERRHRQESTPYHQFAILYRINPQAKLFEEALRSKGVPYRIIGGTALFDRAEVRDWIAYLRLLVNPKDEMSFRRVANVPRRALGPAAIGRIEELSKTHGKPFTEVLETLSHQPDVSAKARKGANEFSELLSQWRPKFKGVRGTALSGVAQGFFDAIGLESFIRKSEQSPVLAQRRIESVIQLIEGMGSESSDETLSSYLMRITLDSRASESDTDNLHGVTLLTLHSSKGLEFPVVYLVGFEKDLLPHRMSADRPTAIAEERRLCYVGMTRAMRRLTLTSARTRTQRGERIPKRPSRFLEEIPSELLDKRDQAQTLETKQVERNKANFAKIQAMLKGD